MQASEDVAEAEKRISACQLFRKKISGNKFFIGVIFLTIGAVTLSSSVTTYFSFRSSAHQIYGPPLRNRTFTIDPKNNVFLKDGHEFQFISGSLHYFRIPELYWSDRLIKAKALGLDAVQIDIPWNFHEREENQFDFSGAADVEQFIFVAHQHDLLMIVRIGPYIGADWSLGGLPAWLLRKHPDIEMRTSDTNFMNAVTKWFNVLLPKLKPHLYSNGGPIIMIQLENDYGSYKACDRNYLASLNSLVKQHLGSDVILSTVDVGSKNALRCGSPFSANLATIFFGPYEGDPDDKFTDLLEFQPNAPWINSEYYTGWMDHWGYAHFHVSPQHFTEGLINLMAYSPRISVNIYMLHGGTNFGLWSGAVDRPFSAQITSYDYNAPLSEDGDTTHFYQLLRAAIFKRKNITAPALPRNSTKRAYETIQQRLVSHIIAYSTNGATSQAPLPMESLRQYEGFMVYRTQFYRNAGQPVRLKFKNVADYVYIYTASVNLDSLVFHGTVSRNDRSFVFHFTPTINTTDLIILVENAGYISYASRNFNDQKGIFGPISADGRELLGWTMMPICLTPYSPFQCNESLSEDISKKFLTLQSNTQQNNSIRWPVEGSVFVGSLDIRNPEDIADTFVLLTNFTRGILIVNDKILGRFNQALGPQLRLYLPKSFLKTGSNIFITIELDSLWLNETMVGGIVPKDMLYPIAFDREMHWHTKRKRPTY